MAKSADTYLQIRADLERTSRIKSKSISNKLCWRMSRNWRKNPRGIDLEHITQYAGWPMSPQPRYVICRGHGAYGVTYKI